MFVEMNARRVNLGLRAPISTRVRSHLRVGRIQAELGRSQPTRSVAPMPSSNRPIPTRVSAQAFQRELAQTHPASSSSSWALHARLCQRHPRNPGWRRSRRLVPPGKRMRPSVAPVRSKTPQFCRLRTPRANHGRCSPPFHDEPQRPSGTHTALSNAASA